MTTYEQGKAPADAPVTWRNGGSEAPYKIWRMSDGYAITYSWAKCDAELICRAFHLAALADEMGAWLFDTGKESWCADWLRRYRAAKESVQ